MTERNRGNYELPHSRQKYFKKFRMCDSFKSVATHTELQELFDGDLKDPIGSKQEEQRSTRLSDSNRSYPVFFQPNIFQRLAAAMLARDNGRLILLDIIAICISTRYFIKIRIS
jgi:hypothetical protein